MKYLLKKIEKILLVTFFALQTMFIQAQTYTPPGGTATLTTQTEVTALGTDIGTNTIFAGDITIEEDSDDATPAITDLSSLSGLTSIGGHLRIEGNAALETIGDFSALTSIGGIFDIRDNVKLQSLGDFSALTSIGGYLDIRGNGALETIGNFTALTSIGGYLTILGNDNLQSLGDFSALGSIGGVFDIRDNVKLQSLGNLSALESIGGYLTILRNVKLQSLSSFSALTSIMGYLYIENNSLLQSLDGFSALTSIGGYLRIHGNANLQSLDGFSALTSIGGYLYIENNSLLLSLDNFSRLTSIGTGSVHVPSENARVDGVSIVVERNLNLFVCCDLANFLPAQANPVGGRVFINNNSASCNLPSTGTDDEKATAFSGVCETATFTTQTQIDAFDFATSPARDITIGPSLSNSDPITDISNLSGITPLLSLTITGNPELQNLDGLSDLKQISGDFVISDNANLQSLGNSYRLLRIGENFVIRNNANLQSLGNLSKLRRIEGNLEIRNNTTLPSLGDLSALTRIGGYLGIQENTNLQSLGNLSNLTSIGSGDGVSVPSESDPVDGVSIVVEANPKLFACCDLADFLPAQANPVSSRIYINNNLAGCNLADSGTDDEKAAALSGICGTTTFTLQSEIDAFNSATSHARNIVIGPSLSASDPITNLSRLSGITSLLSLSITGNEGLEFIDDPMDNTNNGLVNLATIINGLTISNNTVLVNLDGFSALTAVGGNITVKNNAGLESLGDLSALTSIGGNLFISGNGNLESLGDLSTLTSIGVLNINSNTSLQSIDNFSALETVGQNLVIFGNGNLQSIDNFFALTSVGGNLQINNNSTLLSIGNFSSLTSIGGYLRIKSNGNLKSLGNFSALTNIMGHLQIQDNTNLLSLGDFSALTGIGGDLLLQRNGALETISSFSALENIGGKLDVGSNTNLLSLGDFSALTGIEGNLLVGSNANLLSLGDFSALETIGGYLFIKTNAELQSLGNFSALTSIGGGSLFSRTTFTFVSVSIIVEDNPKLFACCDLADFLPAQANPVSSRISITNNSAGCNLADSGTDDEKAAAFSAVCEKLTFTTQTQIDNFDFANIIAKNVVIGPSSGSNAITNLSRLSAITTLLSLTITENQELQNVGGLSNLTHISGNLSVANNPKLQSISDFPALKSIGGYLNINFNFVLETIGNFSALTSIGGVNIQNNFALETIGNFSALKSIGGGFSIIRGVNLETIGDLSALETIGGEFFILQNSALETIGDFSALKSIGGDLQIQSNTNLLSLGDLSALTSIGGYLQIQSNTNLLSLGDLSALTSIGGYLGIQENTNLLSLGNFSALTSIGSGDGVSVPSERNPVDGVSIVVEANPKLFACCDLADFLPAQANALSGRIFINDNLASCNLADSGTDDEKAAAFSGVCGTTTFTLQSEIDAFNSATSHARNIVIGPSSGADAITNLSRLSAITSLLSLTITGNQSLEFIANPTDNTNNGLVNLATIVGDLTISNNTVLVNLDGFPALTAVGGISMSDNAKLQNLSGLSNLTQVGGNLQIQSNGNLESLGNFSALTSVGGNLSIVLNGALESLGDLSALKSIGGTLNINENAELQSLGDFSALKSIGEFVSISSNVALETIGNFSALKSIGGYLGISDNDALETMGDLSALTSIGGYLGIEDNGALETIGNFPALTSIGGYVYITGNANLQSLSDLSALTSIGSNRVFVPSESAIIDNVSIVVEANPKLFACCDIADFLPAQANALSGRIFISGNSASCNLPSTGTDDEKAAAFSGVCGTTTFTLQSEIDAFDLATTTTKNIVIGPSSGADAITNLSRLSAITSLLSLTITGNEGLEFIANPTDNTNNGLVNLATIVDGLSISNNPLLTNLNGFPLLNAVGNISVQGNASLVSLGNFPALTEINEFFNVQNNANLLSLGNLPLLESIGKGSVFVTSRSDIVENVAIVVEENPSLSSCCALDPFVDGGANAITIETAALFFNNNDAGCDTQANINCTNFLHITGNPNISSDATQTQINVVSNTRWQLSKPNTGANWITELAIGSNSHASNLISSNDAVVVLTHTANSSIQERPVTLTLSAVNESDVVLIMPTAATIDLTQEAGAVRTLMIEGGKNRTLTNTGGTENIVITSNSPWQVTVSGDLTSLSSLSFAPDGGGTAMVTNLTDGNGTFDTSGGGTLTIAYTENRKNAVQNGNIKLEALNGTTPITENPSPINIALTQEIAPPTLVISSDDVTLAPDDVNVDVDYTYAADVAGLMFNVKAVLGGSAEGWKVAVTNEIEDTDGFVTLPDDPTAGGDVSLAITIKENMTIEVRTATLTFTATGGTGTAGTQVLKITQTAASSPTLSLTGVTPPEDSSIDHTYMANAAGETLTVDVTLENATGWNAAETSEFISLDKATGENNGTLAITINENMTIAERMAKVTFMSTGGVGEVAMETLLITQAAAVRTLMIEGTNPNSRTLDPTGGTEDIVITSNSPWRMTTPASLPITSLTFTPKDGTKEEAVTDIITLDREGNGTVTIAYTENRKNAAQNGNVKLEALDGLNNPLTDNPMPITIALTQEIAPPTLMISSDDVTLAPDDVNVDVDYTYAADAAGLMFNVKAVLGGSAEGWEVAVTNEIGDTDGFVTLPDDPTAGDDVPLAITIKENNTLGQRTATLTFTATGGTGTAGTQVLKITQTAASSPTLSLTGVTPPEDSSIDHTYMANAAGETLTVDVTLENATGWNAAETSEFISLDKATGENNGTLAITINENMTIAERMAKVTFMSTGGVGEVAMETLLITQAAAVRTLMIEGTNPNSRTLDPTGGTEDIVITSNSPWRMTTPASLPITSLTFTPKDGTKEEAVTDIITLDREGNGTVTIAYTENRKNAAQNGNVKLEALDGLNNPLTDNPMPITIALTQEIAPPTLMISSDDVTLAPDDVNVDVDYTYAADAAGLMFNVKAVLGGSAEGWEVAVTNEIGDTDGFVTLPDDPTAGDDVPLAITIKENNTLGQRTATITFMSTGGTGIADTQVLKITQTAASSPTLSLTGVTPPKDSSIDHTYMANAAGETLTVDVTLENATGWTVSSDVAFVTSAPAMGDNDTDAVLTITPNMTIAERTATLTFTTTGGTGIADTQVLKITQTAASSPTITLTGSGISDPASGATAYTADVAATEVELTVNVTLENATGWTVSSDVAFVTSAPAMGDNDVDAVLTITPNMTIAERTATLTFTTTGGVVDVTKILTITQAAGAHMIAVANPNSRTLDPTGGTEEIVITSNSSWRVTTSNVILVSSITLTSSGTPIMPSGGVITLEGVGNGTITITYTENRTNAAQSGNIKLEALDGATALTENPTPITIALTQEVAPPTLVISSADATLSKDDEENYSTSINAAGLVLNIKAVLGGSAAGWSATETSEFISLDKATAGDGETLAITIDENMTIAERTATIILITTGHEETPDSVSLTITQEAAPKIMLTSHTEDDSIAIAHDNTDPITIDFTLEGSATGWTDTIIYIPDTTNFITMDTLKDDTISITITPSVNTSAEPRTATITLITTGHEGTPDSVSLTITQGARADTTTLPPKDTTTTLYSYTRVDFLLYPNPTNGTLTIEGVTGYLQMYIYDLVGREVMTYSLTPSKKTIDVSDLPSGMYVVTLRGKGKTWKEILMKK